MRSIYMMSVSFIKANNIKKTVIGFKCIIIILVNQENEQKLRYLVDTKVLHKDMEALSRKLRRITSTLHSIETMELPPQVKIYILIFYFFLRLRKFSTKHGFYFQMFRIKMI